jgi:hypothetical protein
MRTTEGAEAKYHSQYSRHSTDKQLEKWASDPNCIEMEECAKTLARRRARRDEDAQALVARKKALEENPFDHRTETTADINVVSADAKYIVKHLWIMFIVIPFVVGLVLMIANALVRS